MMLQYARALRALALVSFVGLVVAAPRVALATPSVNGGTATVANNSSTCPGVGCFTYQIVGNAFAEITIANLTGTGASDTFQCQGPPGSPFTACSAYLMTSNVVSNTAQTTTNTDGTFFLFTPTVTAVRVLSNGAGTATNQTLMYLVADTQAPAPVVSFVNLPLPLQVSIPGGITPANGSVWSTNISDPTVAGQNAHVTPAGGLEIAGTGDPCLGAAKLHFDITTSASGWDTTPIVSGTAGNNVHVCSIFGTVNSNISLGQAAHGGSCASPTVLSGPFTFTTNLGFTHGDGEGDIGFGTTTQGYDWCLDNISANTVTLHGTYVLGP